MKLTHIYAALLVCSTGLFASCSDFLDKEPLDAGSDAAFFKTPEQFHEATAAYYNNVIAWKDFSGSMTSWTDQNTDITGLSSSGSVYVPTTDVNWTKPYNYIRNYNLVLEKLDAYTGDKNDKIIKWSYGESYFFRAWQYFFLLKRFGGVPVVLKAMDLNDEGLQGARNSRYEVYAQIESDLNKAIENLPEENTISKEEKGRISKETAEAFLGRVALYEGTWEKYATPENIGYDLDGDGEKEGAGKKKPANYPSVQQMLTTARDNSLKVIESAEAGTYKLFTLAKNDSLSYYYLFNLEGNCWANPENVGKDANKEFIFATKYDLIKNNPNANINKSWLVNISAELANKFPCRNGLPIYASKTQSTDHAQYHNPEFKGYAHFTDEFRNRDYRFISSVSGLPDRFMWGYSTNSENSGGGEDGNGTPYPVPVDKTVTEKINGKDETYTLKYWEQGKKYLGNPTIRGGAFATYGSRKFRTESPERDDFKQAPDFPQIRLAEVYLNYAEAVCELGNGAISDADLNRSINLIRKRAGIAPLTNELIAGYYDNGYWDMKQGKTVSKKMNMLDEIRRERACELFGEGFRLDDLKRWGLAQYALTGNHYGRQLLGTQYMTAYDNDPASATVGTPCYDEKNYPLSFGYVTDKSSPDYGRSIAIPSANLIFKTKDYLSPIPTDEIMLDNNLKQNPGW